MNKEDLKKTTKAKLLDLARERGFKGVSKLKKEELIRLLLKGKTEKKPVEKACRPAAVLKTAVESPAQGRYEALTKWQEEIINSKYDSFLPEADNPASQQTGEYFPESPVNKAVLMIQDSFNLYLYWEIPAGDISGNLLVRVYEETDSFFEVEEVQGGNRAGCHIQLPQAGRTCYAQVGIIEEGGSFKVLAKSNTIQTPPAGRAENCSGLSGKQFDRLSAYILDGSSSWGPLPGDRFEHEWASRAWGGLHR